MIEPSVAIILVNWNGYQDTIACLDSLKNINYKNYKVFIVDNNSNDDSYNQLIETVLVNKKYIYDIYLIKSETNLGFAGGNNLAIKEAYKENFDFIWLLNNDTVVEKDSLSELIKCIASKKKVGIVGSKIFYYQSDLLWFAGGKINKFTCSTAHLGFKEQDSILYNSVCDVDYITGCSMLFRKEVIESVGYMLEDYFLYYEETDFNIRAKKAGWDILFVPSSIIYHKVSLSTGGEKTPSPIRAYFEIRNRFWMCKRNYKNLVCIAIFSIAFSTIKKLLKVILYNQNKKRDRFVYIFRGFKDGLMGGN